MSSNGQKLINTVSLGASITVYFLSVLKVLKPFYEVPLWKSSIAVPGQSNILGCVVANGVFACCWLANHWISSQSDRINSVGMYFPLSVISYAAWLIIFVLSTSSVVYVLCSVILLLGLASSYALYKSQYSWLDTGRVGFQLVVDCFASFNFVFICYFFSLSVLHSLKYLKADAFIPTDVYSIIPFLIGNVFSAIACLSRWDPASPLTSATLSVLLQKNMTVSIILVIVNGALVVYCVVKRRTFSILLP